VGLEGADLLWIATVESGVRPELGILRPPQAGYHRADGTFLYGRVALRTQSDADGRFALHGLACGEGELWLRHEGLAVLRVPLTIRPWAQNVSLTLEPGASLAGTVRDMYGEPVAGALVERGRTAEPDHDRVWSDELGRFRFEHVPPGACTLFAFREGVGSTTRERIVPASGELTWNLRFEERFVGGRIVDEEGHGLAGWTARVGLDELDRLASAGRHPPAEADAQGYFLLSGCPDGPFHVNIDAGDALRVIRSIPDVRAGTELEVVIPRSAHPSAVLRGRVQDRTLGDVPARLAAVRLWEDPELIAVARHSVPGRVQQPGGAFELGPLPAGRYMLMLDAPGRALQWSGPFELAPEETTDLGTIWLEEPGRFRVASFPGTRDDYDQFLIQAGTEPEMIVHVGDGSFAEDVVLPPGPYSLVLSGYGYQGSYRFRVRSGELTVLDLDRPTVRRRLELVWPSDPAVERARVLVFESGGTQPVAGWLQLRGESTTTEISLAVGDYTLEVRTNTGTVRHIPVAAHADEPVRGYVVELDG